LVFFERTPATKSEFYFELDNGTACFLAEEGILFFSLFSDLGRKIVRTIPIATSAVFLTLAFLTEFGNVTISWASPALFTDYSLLLLIIPYATGKILSRGRAKRFSGKSLEQLLNGADQKYLRHHHDWSEVREVKLRHYRVILKWYSSTFLFDRGVNMKFDAKYYSDLRAFLLARLGSGKFVEKP
jgi:hypothetical protein